MFGTLQQRPPTTERGDFGSTQIILSMKMTDRIKVLLYFFFETLAFFSTIPLTWFSNFLWRYIRNQFDSFTTKMHRGLIIFYVQLRLEQIYGLINPIQPQVGKRGISFILRWWVETGQPTVWPVVTQKQFVKIYWNSAQERNQELIQDINQISATIINYNS